MKNCCFPIRWSLVAFVMFGLTAAQAQTYDKELNVLAASVSKSLQQRESKKVTVLDFMDLQGNVNELGRFLAEQFSVALVVNRQGFSVMDRANLKTILAEHKLSISGLVEPENAKKLGQFSGVDAILLGTLTVLQEEAVVTVKVIATDTAEIIGAATARIQKSKDIETLFPALVTGSSLTEKKGIPQKQPTEIESAPGDSDLARHIQIDKNSTHSGGFFVKVESIRQIYERDHEFLLATIVLVNTNKAKPIWVTLPYNGAPYSTITDKIGNVYQSENYTEITGIAVSYPNKSATEIEPNTSLKFTIRHNFPPRRKGRDTAITDSLRLAFTMRTGSDFDGYDLKGARDSGVLVDYE